MIQKYTSFRMSLLLGASSLAITISFNASANQTNDYGQTVPTPNTVGFTYIDPTLYPDYEYSENFHTPYFSGGGLRVPPDGLFVEQSFFLEGPLKELSGEPVFYGHNYNLDGSLRVDLRALYVSNEVTSHSNINQANGKPVLSIYAGNLIEGTYTPSTPPSVDILNTGQGATTVLYQNYAQGARITNSEYGKFYIDNNTVIEASINNSNDAFMFIEGNYAESVIINNYNDSFMSIKGNTVNNALINNGSPNSNESSTINIHYNTATDTTLKNDNGSVEILGSTGLRLNLQNKKDGIIFISDCSVQMNCISYRPTILTNTKIDNSGHLIVSGNTLIEGSEIVNNHGAVLDIHDNTSIRSQEDNTAHKIINDGVINIFSGNFTLASTLSGAGNVKAWNAIVSLLSDSSTYTGSTNLENTILNFGKNAKIGGDLNVDSTSKLIGSGQANNVSLQDGSILSPRSNKTDDYSVFTVTGNLESNGGNILISTALGNDQSKTDMLVINGNTSGSSQVIVTNLRGAGALTVNGIKIIEVGGNSEGNFTLKSSYTHDNAAAVVGGAYAYKLFKGGKIDQNEKDWYLRSELKDKEPLYQAGAPVYEVYPQFLLGLNNLPTMQQRVGNRYWNNAGNKVIAQGADAVEAYVPAQEAGSLTQTNGVWGRIEGAHTKMEPNTSTTDANYDFNAYKMQAGLDGMVYENEQGKLIAGATVHYTHGLASIWSPYDVDLGRGRIQTDGYGFGATLTWAGDDGFYVDNQAQLTWYRSELSYAGGKSELKDGKNNGFGYALSSEVGKRFALDQHWSLTPQAQLQYSNVDFSDFTDVFGADVSRKKGDSLRGRLGLSVNYQNSWQNAQGRTDRSSVYGIVNLYNEFLSGTKVRVSTEDFINKSERFWGGIGFGGSYNWNDDKYSIYGEGSVNTSFKNFGDSYNYKGTLGVRVKW